MKLYMYHFYSMRGYSWGNDIYARMKSEQDRWYSMPDAGRSIRIKSL